MVTVVIKGRSGDLSSSCIGLCYNIMCPGCICCILGKRGSNTAAFTV